MYLQEKYYTGRHAYHNMAAIKTSSFFTNNLSFLIRTLVVNHLLHLTASVFLKLQVFKVGFKTPPLKTPQTLLLHRNKDKDFISFHKKLKTVSWGIFSYHIFQFVLSFSSKNRMFFSEENAALSNDHECLSLQSCFLKFLFPLCSHCRVDYIVLKLSHFLVVHLLGIP